MLSESVEKPVNERAKGYIVNELLETRELEGNHNFHIVYEKIEKREMLVEDALHTATNLEKKTDEFIKLVQYEDDLCSIKCIKTYQLGTSKQSINDIVSELKRDYNF
ncbi:hypothetical protein ACJ2A9_10590 [Anaerobacillus sp. MEB173]|uniref:hypothetical protein n=1 Tax=Anaerobacillus sp. MEB173 TaxID=3383345 RepID=UPI003F90D7D1